MDYSELRLIIHELTPLKVVRLGRGKAVAHEVWLVRSGR